MMRHDDFNRRRWLQISGAAWAALDVSEAVARGDGEQQTAGSLTDVGGLRVGHWTHTRRPTGCTVTIFEGEGAVAGVDVRGAAPGTRETDLLNPLNTVERVNAIVLSGGSAFGLDTASGVMQFLAEKGVGFRVGTNVVPIVPAAILFDLGVGDGTIRPDAAAGYAACKAAESGPVKEGNVGAGAGATVGKLAGSGTAMKGGLGTASMRVGETDLRVAAMVALNAVGDIIDARSGRILAGALTADGKGFRGSASLVASGALLERSLAKPGAHSTIAVVATNALLTKAEANKVAQMAHDGFARSINPVHTPFDGDTIFAAATGMARTKANVLTIGVAAAEVMAQAIRRAAITAESLAGYRAYRDLPAELRQVR